MFCARLFICALWSPAGKGLTSWLSFVVSSVSLSLSHWYPGSGVVLDCIDSWSLHLTYFYHWKASCIFSDSETSLPEYKRVNQSTPQEASHDYTKLMTPQAQTRSNSEYTYICAVCGKGFDFPSHMERHNRIHSGIKPFACKFCDRRFATKGNMQSHIVTHYKDLNK